MLKFNILIACIILGMLTIMLSVEVIVKHTTLSEDQAMGAFWCTIVVVVYILVHVGYALGTRSKKPKYAGPERRKQQTLVHPKRRSTDIVGRDNWGGPGRYCK